MHTVTLIERFRKALSMQETRDGVIEGVFGSCPQPVKGLILAYVGGLGQAHGCGRFVFLEGGDSADYLLAAIGTEHKVEYVLYAQFECGSPLSHILYLNSVGLRYKESVTGSISLEIVNGPNFDGAYVLSQLGKPQVFVSQAAVIPSISAPQQAGRALDIAKEFRNQLLSVAGLSCGDSEWLSFLRSLALVHGRSGAADFACLCFPGQLDKFQPLASEAMYSWWTCGYPLGLSCWPPSECDFCLSSMNGLPYSPCQKHFFHARCLRDACHESSCLLCGQAERKNQLL